MRIFVVNVRTAAKLVLLIAFAVVLVFFATSRSIRAISSFIADSSEKQLPVYSVDCEGKKAAITFDCAWGASDIPDILETLKKEQVKATFFIVGQWAEKYPDEVKLIAEAGHDIGNHGYSHLRMGVLDNKRVKSEITDCSNALQRLTGQKIDLFRPPYGDYNASLVTTAKSLGCYTIQWNVDSLDWKPDISGDEIMKRISTRLVPGSILLFHNDTKHTAAMLADIIQLVKSSEYEIVPVSKLIIRNNYNIDYEGRQHPSGK